jgi:steroid delta-isomerase-like uncharacterized protein
MSAEQNKELIRQELEAWNNKDLAAFDRLFARNYVHNDPSQPEVTNLEGMKQFAQGIWAAYPDFNAKLESLVADEDLVVKRYTMTGTHQGEFAGVPPTGNRVSFTGMTMFRIEGGKIVEAWWNYDVMSVLQQIGAVPQTA